MRVTLLVPLLAATSATASTVNYEQREINVKVVYVSAAHGAHDNLASIFEKTNPGKKAPPPKGDTFDSLTLALGEIRGFKTLFDLTGVRSEPQHPEGRQLMFKGADGVIFVANASPHAQKENKEVFERLKKDLAANGLDVAELPLVLQLDTDGVQAPVTAEALRKTLGLTETTPVFSATPTTGEGVFDTLKAMAKKVLTALKSKSTTDSAR